MTRIISAVGLLATGYGFAWILMLYNEGAPLSNLLVIGLPFAIVGLVLVALSTGSRGRALERLALRGGIAITFGGLALYLLLPFYLWWNCRQNPQNDCVGLLQVLCVFSVWLFPMMVVGIVLVGHALWGGGRSSSDRARAPICSSPATSPVVLGKFQKPYSMTVVHNGSSLKPPKGQQSRIYLAIVLLLGLVFAALSNIVPFDYEVQALKGFSGVGSYFQTVLDIRETVSFLMSPCLFFVVLYVYGKRIAQYFDGSYSGAVLSLFVGSCIGYVIYIFSIPIIEGGPSALSLLSSYSPVFDVVTVGIQNGLIGIAALALARLRAKPSVAPSNVRPESTVP